jgi:hypothetical protein
VARAAALGLRGRTFTPAERQRVSAALSIYPVWLAELSRLVAHHSHEFSRSENKRR